MLEKLMGFRKQLFASFIVFKTYPTYGNYEGGGAKEFRNGIANRIDTRRFDWNDRFNVIVEFIITKDFKIENIVMIKSSLHEEIDKQIVFGIKSTKKTIEISNNQLAVNRLQVSITIIKCGYRSFVKLD